MFNRIGNAAFNIFIRTSYKTNLSDILSGYRAFNKNVAKSIRLVSNYFEVETEMTIESLEKNFRVLEIPIAYKLRSDNPRLNPIKDGLRIALAILRLTRDYKPMVVFGGLSLIFSATGALMGWFALDDFLITGKFNQIGRGILSVLLLLLGIEFFTLAFIADMIASKFRRLEAGRK